MDPSLGRVAGALVSLLTLIDSNSAPKMEVLASQNAHFQAEIVALKQLIEQTKAEENKSTEQQREMLEVIGRRHGSLVRHLAKLKSSAKNEMEFMNYMMPMFYQVKDTNERHRKSLDEIPAILELLAKVQSLQAEIQKLTSSLQRADEDITSCEKDLKILKQQASSCRSTKGSKLL